MSQLETNCSRCDHMIAMGITILDAMWLDPACHKGCRSLGLKQRITELEAALRVFLDSSSGDGWVIGNLDLAKTMAVAALAKAESKS